MLTVGVLFLGTPLLLTCAGFLILMAAQAFVFGNSGALAASQATHIAGSASAALGVAMALAGAVAAPLASSGGGETAVPMIIVMITGVTCSVLAFLFLTRPIGSEARGPGPPQGTNRCPTPGSVRKCRGRLGTISSLRRSWAMKTRR